MEPTAAPKLPLLRLADMSPTDICAEIDNSILFLTTAVEGLKTRVDNMHRAGSVLDLDLIERRGAAIARMRSLHTELQRLAATVARNGMAAETAHLAEIKAAQEGLSRASARVAPKPASAAAAAARPALPAPVPLAHDTGRHSVGITDGIAVDAVVVSAALRDPKDILAAVSAAELHYIPQWDHFAVRFGSCVLHAGVGRVYRSPPAKSAGQETPARVKECRHLKCGTDKGCRYYHDPEEYPGSTDIRNYMVDSWLYSPTTAAARYGTRRFGSRPDLDVDIQGVSAEDARRFLHQTAHDIICAVILWKYVVAPAGPRKKQSD